MYANMHVNRLHFKFTTDIYLDFSFSESVFVRFMLVRIFKIYNLMYLCNCVNKSRLIIVCKTFVRCIRRIYYAHNVDGIKATILCYCSSK